MNSTDSQSAMRKTLPRAGEPILEGSAQLERATGRSVRKILWASLTRTRNLALLGTFCVCALALAGLGFGWLGLATIGAGAMVSSSLIAADSVNDDFLREVFSIPGPYETEDEMHLANVPPLEFDELDEELRVAYEAVLRRKLELQRLLGNGPPVLRASLREGNRVCESLVANALRLARRGQRLGTYLRTTNLAKLTKSACEAVSQIDGTNDGVAANTYMRIASGRQQHMETHIEVEGLYERVVAQLVLIETILAGAVAKIVKITATDDEESSFSASLVNEQLELLSSDVSILESSLDQVSETRLDEPMTLSILEEC